MRICFISSSKKNIPKMLVSSSNRKKTKNIHERISAHLSDWMKPFNDLSNGFNARWHWSTQIIKIKPENEQKKLRTRKKYISEITKTYKSSPLSGELTWLQCNRFKRRMSGWVFVAVTSDHSISICYGFVHIITMQCFLCGGRFHLVILFCRIFILVFPRCFCVLISS